MSTANAGWFPDPMGRHELRYWNGSEWSEHVSDAGHMAVDALAPPTENAAPAHAGGHALPPPTLATAAPTVHEPEPVHVPEPVSPPPASPASPIATASSASMGSGATKQGVATWKIVAAIAAVAALAVGAIFVFRGGDDADDAANAAEVFLEPAVAVGADPFTPSVDTNTAPPPVRIVPTAAGSSATTLPPTTLTPTTPAPSAAATTLPAPTTTAAPVGGVRSVDAAAPGLYGGTRNNSSCNQEQMISFLAENPDKAAAWAGVQGIDPADIAVYIRALTPFVLRADTRVTNFGFRDGGAYAKAAILQMGTAVLVDEYGIPRARCSCGNPLAPPRPQPAGYTYTGNPWPGFDPLTVIVVVNVTNVVIDEYVVVDLTGGYFGRRPAKTSPTGVIVDGDIYIDSLCDLWPEAPECLPPVETVPTTLPETVPSTLPEPVLGTGDIQFTLRWSSTADLDLAVLDPNGEEIAFDTPTSSSGGTLDVDSNAACEAAVPNPVENIFWPVGQSPVGIYYVEVRYYAECGAGVGPQPFTLTVLIDGVEVAVQPVVAALVRTDDTVGSPGDSRQYQVDKTAAAPITVPPTVAPTAPPVATTSPPTEPTVPIRVPVTTPQPIGSPPTTVTPGQTISLEDYCQSLYGPGAFIGPMHPSYTLCMHDPTVA